MKKYNKILSMIILLIMVSNTFVFGDININQNIKGAMLSDLITGEVLYEFNKDEQLAIASTSKIMTYLVTMDSVKNGKISLDDDVLISQRAAQTPGSKFGIIAGEKIKLSLLLSGMLVVSGNDCATAVAEHVGGSEDNFVSMMMDKAKKLGLHSAKFVNADGLPLNDDETVQNFMSIIDLNKLVNHVLLNFPEVLEITKQKELVVPERNFRKTATNPILKTIEGADGLKTGYTDKAGYCLVITIPVKDKGEEFRLVGIIMGAFTEKERLEKSEELMRYGKENFKIAKFFNQDDVIDNVYILNSKLGKVEVYTKEAVQQIVKIDSKVETKIIYDQNIKAPLSKGDKIGTISIYVNGNEVKNIDAVVNEDVEKAKFFVVILRRIKNLFN